jgi:hypothetical protein
MLTEFFLFQEKKCLANQILLVSHFNKYLLKVRIVFSIRNYFLLCSCRYIEGGKGGVWITFHNEKKAVSRFMCLKKAF